MHPFPSGSATATRHIGRPKVATFRRGPVSGPTPERPGYAAFVLLAVLILTVERRDLKGDSDVFAGWQLEREAIEYGVTRAANDAGAQGMMHHFVSRVVFGKPTMLGMNAVAVTSYASDYDGAI